MKEICKILKGVWGELAKPESFEDDWYKGCLNQCSHSIIGVVSAAIVVSCYSLWADELPFRSIIAIGFSFLFILYIQIYRQGWKGADTIWDSYFYILGLCAALFSFVEIDAEKTLGHDFALAFFPERLLFFVITGITSLLIYSWPRMKRQYGSHNDDKYPR